MKRIKTMLLAVVAVMAIGAVGASAAQAGTGHITTNLGSCDFTFSSTYSNPDSDSSHTPPWVDSWDLTNFAPDTSAGKSCDASDFEADLHLHRDANNNAQAIGSISITSIIGTCDYAGTLNGTYSGPAPGTSGPGTFTLVGTQSVSNTGGSFLCPGSVSVQSPTTLNVP